MFDNHLISVILPVYNGEKYLKEAIDSILFQTHKNLELIIINDGSTDSTKEIIDQYSDKRIISIHQKNSGLAESLNNGLKIAKGEYIARQDADDISLPRRLEKQIQYLINHPKVVLLGTRAKIFTNTNDNYGIHNHATNPAQLHFDLFFNNPFVHSSVMFRKLAIDKVGMYNGDRSLIEDYELWSRFVQIGQVSNLPDILVLYRHHDAGISKESSNYYKEKPVINQNKINFNRFLNLTNDEIEYFISSVNGDFNGISDKKLNIEKLNLVIIKISKKLNTIYPEYTDEIEKRKKEYLKIIKWRANKFQRLNTKNPLKLFFLKVSSKLQQLISEPIND
ncbi:MAG: glycosyltransferase [Bacteroidetes bacterium]|nr:glycosyltransferase [Bacteroidota bacterium]